MKGAKSINTTQSSKARLKNANKVFKDFGVHEQTNFEKNKGNRTKMSPKYIQKEEEKQLYEDEYDNEEHQKRPSVVNNNLSSITSSVNQRMEFSHSPLREFKSSIKQVHENSPISSGIKNSVNLKESIRSMLSKTKDKILSVAQPAKPKFDFDNKFSDPLLNFKKPSLIDIQPEQCEDPKFHSRYDKQIFANEHKLGSEMAIQPHFGIQESEKDEINRHDIITIDNSVINFIDEDRSQKPDYFQIKEEDNENDYESDMSLILSKMLKDRKKNANNKAQFRIKKKDIKISSGLKSSDNTTAASPFSTNRKLDLNMTSKNESGKTSADLTETKHSKVVKKGNISFADKFSKERINIKELAKGNIFGAKKKQSDSYNRTNYTSGNDQMLAKSRQQNVVSPTKQKQDSINSLLINTNDGEDCVKMGGKSINGHTPTQMQSNIEDGIKRLKIRKRNNEELGENTLVDEVVERFEEDNQSEQDDPNLYIKLDGILYNEDRIAKTPFENVNDRHHRNEAIKIHNRYQKGRVEEGFTQSNSNLAIFVSKQDDSYINEE